MSDSYKGLIVTFEKDIHEDHIKKIISAIEQIKYVVSVKHEVADFQDMMARERIKHEIWLDISKVFYKDYK